MKHTTNYRLNLPDRTDKFSIAHANDNMTAIDTKFKQTDTKFTEVQASTTTQIATAKSQQTALLNAEVAKQHRYFEAHGFDRFIIDLGIFHAAQNEMYSAVLDNFLYKSKFTSYGNLSPSYNSASVGNQRNPAITLNHSFPFRFRQIYFYIRHKVDPSFTFAPYLSVNDGATWLTMNKLRDFLCNEQTICISMYRLDLSSYSSAVKAKLDAVYTGADSNFRIYSYAIYFDDIL